MGGVFVIAQSYRRIEIFALRVKMRHASGEGADCTNGAVHGVGLERTEIVHDHDVALPRGRNQDLLDVERRLRR
jgi:hypothetical protein